MRSSAIGSPIGARNLCLNLYASCISKSAYSNSSSISSASSASIPALSYSSLSFLYSSGSGISSVSSNSTFSKEESSNDASVSSEPSISISKLISSSFSLLSGSCSTTFASVIISELPWYSLSSSNNVVSISSGCISTFSVTGFPILLDTNTPIEDCGLSVSFASSWLSVCDCSDLVSCISVCAIIGFGI